ncbi:hypothetical protein [Bacteroides sp.]|uniref:hypothetical protein n=1 Tax=Bacteroides sp. TaxID=29523 RepID=UPI00260E8196|nr:hypothetical protein [Bacteroides sp.]
MELMDLFRKQSREEALRSKIRQGFEDSVMDVIREGAADSPMGGLIVKTAIANFYQRMKSSELRDICLKTGVNFQDILDEEYQNALRKYLEE